MDKKLHISSGIKLVLTLFFIALISSAFISLSSYSSYKKHIVNIQNNLLDYAASQATINLDGKIRECKDLVAQVVMDSEVINLTKGLANPDNRNEPAAVIRNKLYVKLSEYSYYNPYITGMALIIGPTENVVLSRSNESIFKSLKMDNNQFRNHLLMYGDKEYLKQIYITDGTQFPSSNGYEDFVYFIYPAIDPIRQDIYGVFVVELDSFLFNSVILSENNTDILENQISAYSSITNENNRVITSLHKENVGMDFDKLPIPDNAFITKSSTIGSTDLNLNIVFFKATFQDFLKSFQKVTLLYFGIVAIFLFITWGITVKRMYRQSEKIALAINDFRKNRQSMPLDIQKGDSLLNIISDQFNRMSDEISILVTELIEKNHHIEDMMNRQRKAEIKAIEAQINPHFLYNALDRINWIAIDNEQDEISELLSSLGSLLRYSINNIDSMVTLRAELSWMEKYILIQGERFGLDIKLVYDIDETAIDYPIYKMLLQPLIENSVLRGFYKDPINPQISVKASIQPDGRLLLKISDNGCGMDGEKLKQIKEIISNKGEKVTSGVGINNVVSRLYLYYGNQAQISVSSTPGNGTTFTIIIPYMNK